MIFPRRAPKHVLFGLLLCCSQLFRAHGGQGFTLQVYGTISSGVVETSYSTVNTVSFLCTFSDGCVRLKHNGTIVNAGLYFISEIPQPLNLSDAGIYTCESYTRTLEEQCDNDVSSVTGTLDKTLFVIDSRRINVPSPQFVFFNETLELVCESDAYQLFVDKWARSGSNESHSGVITSAKLEEEGNYTCHFSILGNNNTRTTELIVLVKPALISTPVNNYELAFGPNITNYTVIYKAKSPGRERVTWYHDGTELADRVVSTSHDMGGSSIVQISQRSHIGEYRVVIESLFNGYPVSNYITQESKVEFKFNVDVKVPPAVPVISITDLTAFEGTVSLEHTNTTTDDAPDEITLTLFDDEEVEIDVVVLPGSHSKFTFFNLTPSSEYSVKLTVRNVDDIKEGETITIVTEPAEPFVSSFSVIRTDLQEFNLTLAFKYFGAPEISRIRIAYRPIGTHKYKYVQTADCINDQSSLMCSTQLFFADNAIADRRTEFLLEITNSGAFVMSTSWTPEKIEPLSNPSQASVTDLSQNSVSLVIQLPSLGTPPILEISFKLSSTSHTFTHSISGRYMIEEQLTVDIGENGMELQSGVRYTVTARARNFAGWSNFSNGTRFTTYPADTVVVPTSESYNKSLPIWAVILAGVIPCITVLLLLIATILFVCLIKRFWKKPKGYPITELTAADKNQLDSSPRDSSKIGKFFSYDKPLTPRPPTSEPYDLPSYPPSSSHDDSDSEANLTQSPRYKYVVSPTSNEIGIQGFLGSAPGSGTYVYV